LRDERGAAGARPRGHRPGAWARAAPLGRDLAEGQAARSVSLRGSRPGGPLLASRERAAVPAALRAGLWELAPWGRRARGASGGGSSPRPPSRPGEGAPGGGVTHGKGNIDGNTRAVGWG